MSVTGIALVLFLTFHMAMNCVALFSGEAYNMVCEFLGSGTTHGGGGGSF